MKPDVIVTYPLHLTYPLFHQLIHNNRDRFAKVFIVFTNMNANTGDYRDYIRQELAGDRVTFLDSPPVLANEDWRDKAIHFALDRSDSEWVFFLEQDFTPREGFWEEIDKQYPTVDVIGVSEDGRLHPCCLMVKREVLNRTSLDFAARPPEHDHFGQIQKDLTTMIPRVTAFSLFRPLWHHMNGLSQNLYLLQIADTPNYRPQEFKEYCQDCLKLPMHKDFKELFEWYVEEE